MDKRFVFPSLRHSTRHAYTLHTDSMALWDQAYRARSVLWSLAGMFETCGDGMTQHGHEIVVPTLYFEDFCASLAQFLQSGLSDEDRDIFGGYPFHFDLPSARAIEFALSVKYHADKPAWYSKQEMKVSRADCKRHDKRWIEVPEWADGSVKSAYNLLNATSDLLPAYAVYAHIRDFVSARSGDYAPGPREFFKIEGTDVYQAFSALRLTLDSLRLAGQARGMLSCHLGNVMPRATEASDEAKQAA